MKNHGNSLFLGSLAAVLAAACVGFAGSGSTHKTSGQKVNITFNSVVKLRDGITLPAGTYRMEVPENTATPTVTFVRDDKVVATSTAKLVTENERNPSTEIDSIVDGSVQDVVEIRPAGWKTALHFSSEGQ